MIDVASAMIGASGVVISTAVFYAIFAFGRHQGKAPDHVVDMEEVAGYRRQQMTLEALENDVEDTNNTNNTNRQK